MLLFDLAMFFSNILIFSLEEEINQTVACPSLHKAKKENKNERIL